MEERLFDEIRRRNQERWGTNRGIVAKILGQNLHAVAEDILAELIQNAEDAQATTLGLRLLENGLLVWNDGRPFDEKDIWAISGLFVTSKDAAAIGYFGIGFKAVLKVTESPCILSGPYRFRLEQGLDPYPLKDGDPEVAPEAEEVYRRLGGRGAVFWLPWGKKKPEDVISKFSRPNEEDIGDFLLFLERLGRIELNMGQDGKTWEALRQPMEGGWKEVTIRYPGGTGRNYLLLTWNEEMPDSVVEEIVQELDEEDQKKRWRKGQRQVFGIALGLSEEGKPQRIEVGRIFVRLPTGQQTGLPFHLQGRLALNLPRKDVQEDSPLSRWALEMFAKGIRDLPRSLQERGLLPLAWHAFPKKGEGESPFREVAEALLETLKAGEFFYGEDGQACRREQVRLAHRSDLYELLGPDELSEVVGLSGVHWIHKEMRRGDAVEVIRSLGVQEVSRSDVLRWLQTKDERDFWEKRGEEWLRRLYDYLAKDWKSLDKYDLLDIPLVRLRDGSHVPPREAVLPPEDAREIPEELTKEVNQLPLVLEALARDYSGLLRDLGVRDFKVEDVLERLLRRFYGGHEGPDSSTNRNHVRLLFRLRKRVTEETLKKWGKEIPFLQDREGRYVKPCEAYLPAEFGGVPEVEAFFAIAGGRPFLTPEYLEEAENEDFSNEWFGGVDPEQLGNNIAELRKKIAELEEKRQEIEDFPKFLESLGVARLPRALSKCDHWDWLSEAKKWCEEREIDTSALSHSTQGWFAEDWSIDGMDQVLGVLKQRQLTPTEAKALWVVGGCIFKLPARSVSCKQTTFWLSPRQAEIKWFYRTYYCEYGTALWVQHLRKLPWLPDENRQPRRPSELFSPHLKEVLGDSLGRAFVHPEIPLEDKEWARTLGVRFEADPAEVCEYLMELLEQGASPDEVKPIYKWLQEQAETDEDAKTTIRKKFEESPLILIPGRGRCRRSEVCWEDNTGTLPALQPHWKEFRRLFVEFLEVPLGPEPEVVVQHLLNLLAEKADRKEIERVAQEVERLWLDLPEEVRSRLKKTKWPGKQGDEIVWVCPSQLCLRDNEAKAQWFEGRIPWWSLEGLKDLPKYLGVGQISEAFPRAIPSEIRQRDEERTKSLRSLWEALCWMARGQGIEVPTDPPDVYRVAFVRSFFVWNGIESKHYDVKAALYDERALFVAEDAHLRDIGDALEEGFGVPHLREVLKDLWGVKDSKGWEDLLEWWRKKLGILENSPPYPAEPEGKGDEERLAPDEASGQHEEEVFPAPQPPDVPSHAGILVGKQVRSRYEAPRTRTSPLKGGEPVIGSFRPDSQSHRPSAIYRGRPGPDAPDRARTAYQAVNSAIRWLENQGYDVKDVSGYGLGYDLEAQKDNDVRYVEVKGQSQMSPVLLTDNEWRVAKEKGSQYSLFIYVTEPEQAWCVEDPASCLDFREQTRQVVEYVATDWEGKATPLDSTLLEEP